MTRSEAPPRGVDRLAYPDVLEQAEAALVAGRRRAVAAQAPARAPAGTPVRLPDDAVGIGLSGGGVRSATFCLGLFQSLARSGSLGRVDFLSTVSGGGYFGAFLGRLFTRRWITGLRDVERVLAGHEPRTPPAGDADRFAPRVFRWLRDNGRYLAPRGSGDLLLLGAILLRNWLAVQIVLIVSMLTLLSLAQFGRIAAERLLLATRWSDAALFWPVCRPDAALAAIAWSPWLAAPVVPLLVVAVPAGWAYWLVTRHDDGMRGIPAVVGALLTLGGGLAGVAYGPLWDAGAWLPAGAGVAAFCAALALLTLAGGEAWVRIVAPQPDASAADSGNRLRLGLSRLLEAGLVASAVLLAAGLVDTLGGTLYAWSGTGDLWRYGSALGLSFATVGAFARPLYLWMAPRHRHARSPASRSVMLWAAAGLVLLAWLTALDVASHGLRWGFRSPACTATGVPALTPSLLWSTLVLAGYTALFGHTRRFVNLSSVHGFYTARLTRAYLGASNETRLAARTSRVSDTQAGDDCAADAYWHWPRPSPSTPGTPHAAPPLSRPWDKGGPLHLVNTTVNETVDARTGVQNQDRKGTGLAIGPCGLSLGIRHHLVTGADGWRVCPSDPDTHHVFSANQPSAPEPLTLGRWTSISGAAFSTASGATTTVPLAILCGMFNVRLGYWWNSNAGVRRRWLERLLPVQAALLAEMSARTHGTAGQLWNISDGGHFENMGGYELIRRRLPVIVIVDAEADPDHVFQGLSDLVRKARLDFDAEITFLNRHELDGRLVHGSPEVTSPPLPPVVRRYFGELDDLRRHQRARSRAHAALARVSYDAEPGGATSWLVYVKATLTGDEPEDVCHYHRAHAGFPQETTLDQFFDEAQWESYRRLGQHIGHRVLKPELFDWLCSGAQRRTP